MKRVADGRELFVLDGSNIRVHGTFHKTQENFADQQGHRIGLVFLNGLLATRAGHGDGIAWLADSLAEFGYPCFRLDLPGYGDSPGEPPDDWLGYINAGGYAQITTVKIRELAIRFKLSGVVLVGQCSGCVTAIFAAAALPECQGMILMEPYFFLPKPPSSKFREHLHRWALRSRVGGFCSKIYQRIKGVRLFQCGSTLPQNANIALLGYWKKAACAGMPILVMKAPKPKQAGKPATGEFDYLSYIVRTAEKPDKITVAVIESANHTFTNRVGRDAVRQRAEAWLEAHYPIATPEPARAVVSRSGLATSWQRKPVALP